MKLVITTQVRENYGAHAWDGDGKCPQYWKYKGGNDYFLRVSIEAAARGRNFLATLVEIIKPQIRVANEAWEEWVIGWSLEADDFCSEFELDQLEEHGKISYPMKEIFLQTQEEVAA